MRILFQGDSITDTGRNRDYSSKDNLMGRGYAMRASAQLSNEEIGKYEIFNRGISGDRIVDLYARIKMDCWALKPDLISILIGVNDVWHEQNNNDVEPERFERFYDMFITDTLEKLPNVKFMIIEPFVLNAEAIANIYETMSQGVKIRAQIAEKIAKKYNIPYVKLQDKLNEVSQITGVEYWLSDGVHPSDAGHKLIADEWLKVYKTNF